jgi:hypothetical protein
MAAVFTAISLTTLGALIFKDNVEKSGKIDVISSVNNKKYSVIKTGDYTAAADMLASLEDKARAFIAAASVKYPNDTTIKRIQKYWTGSLTEIPQSDTIAYALDKKDLFICVRDNAGNIQQLNDLLFVLLHELSHIQNISYGHDAPFWKQFKRTLEMANKLGYLPYVNYDQYSVTVCGKTINANPATCVFNGSCDSELAPLRPLK